METADSTPLVSVIIPIYNAAEFLRETLDSVCAQTLREIEIICVDDGSTDGTPAILAEYAARDPRFVLLRQQNKFAGAARERGMSEAMGKYLAFLDADDLFEPYMLQSMYEQAERTGADLVCCDADYFYNGETDRHPMPWIMQNLPKFVKDDGFCLRRDCGDRVFQCLGYAPWNKLYLRSHVQESGYEWPHLKYSEDVVFVGCAIFFSHKTALVRKILVHYRERRESISHSSTRDLHPHLQAWELLWNKVSACTTEAAICQSFRNALLNQLLWHIEILNAVNKKELQQIYVSEYDTRVFHLLENPEEYYTDKRLYRYVRSFFLPEISFVLTEPDPDFLPELLLYFGQFNTIIHELLVVDPGNNAEITRMLQQAMKTNIRIDIVPAGKDARATMEACRSRMRAKRYAVLPKGMLLRPGIMPKCPPLDAAKGTEGEIDISPLLRCQSRNGLFRQLSLQKESICLFGKPFFSITYSEKAKTFWLLGRKIWESKYF